MREDRAYFYLPVILCFLCGALVFGLGIHETVTDPQKDWAAAEAYPHHYTYLYGGQYDAENDVYVPKTYAVFYSYTVDGEEYFFRKKTSELPKEGSQADILYNPESPEDAVMQSGSNSPAPLIAIGAFFMLIPLFFLPVLIDDIRWRKFQKSGYAESAAKETEKKRKPDFIGVLFGIVTMAFGAVILCVMAGGFSVNRIAVFLQGPFSLPMLIPLILFSAGIFTVAAGLLGFTRRRNQQAEHVSVSEKQGQSFVDMLETRLPPTPTVGEAVDAFESMCRVSLNAEADDFFFETGVFQYGGEDIFYFSLIRQFKMPTAEPMQVHLHLKYPPTEKNREYQASFWAEGGFSTFFNKVRASAAYQHLERNSDCVCTWEVLLENA